MHPEDGATSKNRTESRVHNSLEAGQLLGNQEVAGYIAASGVDFWMHRKPTDFPVHFGFLSQLMP